MSRSCRWDGPLQSAVSFATAAGTTYYVQIGGFPEAVTYGNLRVAVR